MDGKTVGVYTAARAKVISDAITFLMSGGRFDKKTGERFVPQTHPKIYVRNESGETIPPYGCMQITGTEEIEDYCLVTVTKPTSLCNAEFIFNGHHEIEPTGTGIAQDEMVFRALNNGTAETTYGPTAGQWYLSEGKRWRHIGANEINDYAISNQVVKVVSCLSDFLVVVYFSDNKLVGRRACSGEYDIIEFTDECEEPTCGTATYTAIETDGVLSWSLTTDACTGMCNGVAPTIDPTVVGQTITTNCA